MSFVKEQIRKRTKKRGPDARARARNGALVTVAKSLVDLLSPHRQAAIQVWIDGLEATKEQYDPVTKRFKDVPDTKERRENAKCIIAYTDGQPLALVAAVHGNLEDLATTLGKIRSGPSEVRGALEELSAMGYQLPDSLQKTVNCPEKQLTDEEVHEVKPEEKKDAE